MKLHREYAQGSEAWLFARAGIPTASEWDALVSPGKLEIRKGEMPATYLAQKVAERWYGPLPQPPVFAMEQGNILEERARPWYEFTTGRKAEQVGFITDGGPCGHCGGSGRTVEMGHEPGCGGECKRCPVELEAQCQECGGGGELPGRIGCSPDGWFEDGTGLEIKCPQIVTQAKYLLAGKLPPEYLLQVQGSMLVTGAESWTFLSYHNSLPKLVLTVQRDERAIKVLHEALEAFLEKLDGAFKRLCELNGGPPPKRIPLAEVQDNGGLIDPDDFKM